MIQLTAPKRVSEAAVTTDDKPDLNVPEKIIGELVKVFKLLSDETRLRILFYLTRMPELHVRALCELLDQSQPAVSHHLALLRVENLIESRRDGKHNFYHLVPERFEQLLNLVFGDTPAEQRRVRFESYVLAYSPANEHAMR